MQTRRPNLAYLARAAMIVFVVAGLWWGRPVLIPLALSILLTFLLNPVVDWLHRRGLPRGPAVLAVVFLLAALLGSITWAIGSQLAALADQLPQYKENIRKKIADFRSLGTATPVEKVQNTLKEVAGEIKKEEQHRRSEFAPGRPGAERSENPIPVVIQGDRTWNIFFPAALAPTVEVLSGGALVVVLVIFTLLRQQELRNRMIRLIGYSRLSTTTKALDEASARISRYLLMQQRSRKHATRCCKFSFFRRRRFQENCPSRWAARQRAIVRAFALGFPSSFPRRQP